MADNERSGELSSNIERFLAAARAHAQRIYSTHLDFTERSIADVELILGRLSESIPHGRFQRLIRKQPSPEQIAHIAMIYGIYVGEVLRRKLGGEWRQESVEGEKISASHKNGVLFITIPKREEAKVKPAREIAIA